MPGADGDEIRLGGLSLSVREVGPGESHMDTLWQLDASTVFAGDVAYNGMHADLADGRWRDWLVTLDRLGRAPRRRHPVRGPRSAPCSPPIYCCS